MSSVHQPSTEPCTASKRHRQLHHAGREPQSLVGAIRMNGRERPDVFRNQSVMEIATHRTWDLASQNASERCYKTQQVANAETRQPARVAP